MTRPMADAPHIPDVPGVSLDALIFGGGVAGLWLLDELSALGCRAALLEAGALGGGQTVASQGIIHGGLKYMLSGRLTASAQAIAEMPVVWRQCLAGERQPDLSATPVRSEHCWIWGTGSLKSRFFLMGSTMALRARPVEVQRTEWPAALASVPGRVMKVPEQVIDATAMARNLLGRNRGRAFHVDGGGVRFERDVEGRVSAAHVTSGERAATLRPRWVVLCAGEGNEALRAQLGLPAGAMQRRPLHAVLVRGPRLPELFGHCVDGSTPRITITSARDAAGGMVWQVGGQISEDGVRMSPPELAAHARAELAACVPGLDLAGVEVASFRVDRAEAATASGQRPDDAQVLREGNVITVWPTKLALAPRASERAIEAMGLAGAGSKAAADASPDVIDAFDALAGWPEPPVAPPRWEDPKLEWR